MSRRVVHLRHSVEILTDITPRFGEAWRMHQEHRPALPGATAVDPTGASGRGPGDPTGHTAVLGQQAAHDRRTAELDQALRDLIRAVTVIDTFVRANTPRTATDRDRREAERENTSEPTCEHCTRHRPPGRVELVHRSGDVAGNLPEPMGLCRWCYDAVRRSGRLPSVQEIGRHSRDLKPIRVYG